jgi:ATP-dependent Clp protease, protease subunit
MSDIKAIATKSLPVPMDRSLFFPKQVDQATIGELTEKIIRINESDAELQKIYEIYDLSYKVKPIKIFIDSFGGLVYPCLGLLSVMDTSKTPIHTYVIGSAMSCGFMILISGHKRFAYELSTQMSHQLSTGAFGKIGDVEESVEESVEQSKKLQKILEAETIKRTKMSKKLLKKIFIGKKDFYMNAKQALKLGIIDEIIPSLRKFK